MGLDGETGTGEIGVDGENPQKEEDKEKDGESAKKKEEEEEKEKTEVAASPKTQARATKKRVEYEAAVASDRLGKSEGIHGILKGSIHLTPDRAHALAIAEAAVKNATQAKIEVPVATVGLHHSSKAAHSDSSGTPKGWLIRFFLSQPLFCIQIIGIMTGIKFDSK